MSGIRTAETAEYGQNAEEVPGKVVCPAPKQQNQKKTVRMLKKCRRWNLLRHFFSRIDSMFNARSASIEFSPWIQLVFQPFNFISKHHNRIMGRAKNCLQNRERFLLTSQRFAEKRKGVPFLIYRCSRKSFR